MWALGGVASGGTLPHAWLIVNSSSCAYVYALSTYVHDLCTGTGCSHYARRARYLDLLLRVLRGHVFVIQRSRVTQPAFNRCCLSGFESRVETTVLTGCIFPLKTSHRKNPCVYGILVRGLCFFLLVKTDRRLYS